MTPLEDVISRIVAAQAADAANFVLDLPWSQTRAVLAALAPREVARLLHGVRADRLAELLGHIAPAALPAVLASLSVAEIAELLPLVPLDSAVRVVSHLPPHTVADLLLTLPTQYRAVLQEVLPRPGVAEPAGGYVSLVEQAVRRAAGTVSGRDPHGGLQTEVFGRPVRVFVRDRPGGTFGPTDLHAAVVATDWRYVAGLLVMTNAILDPGLGAAVREARQRGYVVEAVHWQDERDDGLLKRTLVRLVT